MARWDWKGDFQWDATIRNVGEAFLLLKTVSPWFDANHLDRYAADITAVIDAASRLRGMPRATTTDLLAFMSVVDRIRANPDLGQVVEVCTGVIDFIYIDFMTRVPPETRRLYSADTLATPQSFGRDKLLEECRALRSTQDVVDECMGGLCQVRHGAPRSS